MACHFVVDITQPVTSLIEKARNAIINAGGTFDGDASQGNFSVPTTLGTIKGGIKLQTKGLIFT